RLRGRQRARGHREQPGGELGARLQRERGLLGAATCELLELDGAAALGAAVEVSTRLGRAAGAQLAVDVRRHEGTEVLHATVIPARKVGRGFGARCARASRSCARPRWIRERTVPVEMPSVAPISSYDRPSMSHSTTAARYCGLSAFSASWMSTSRLSCSKPRSGEVRSGAGTRS